MSRYFNNLSDGTETKVAKGLGWASVAIGLTELLFPNKLERLLGLPRASLHRSILQTMGVRELMHGFDILSHDDPTPGVWSRVAGDGLDVALLAMAARKTRTPKSFATTAAMVLGIGVLDMLAAKELSERKLYH